jgi:hypothetical protein
MGGSEDVFREKRPGAPKALQVSYQSGCYFLLGLFAVFQHLGEIEDISTSSFLVVWWKSSLLTIFSIQLSPASKAL